MLGATAAVAHPRTNRPPAQRKARRKPIRMTRRPGDHAHQNRGQQVERKGPADVCVTADFRHGAGERRDHKHRVGRVKPDG